jgi:2'-5' RNA ligase
VSGTTALLVPALAAVPLQRRAGTRPRRFVRREQPAHVTIVWPFLPIDRLDESTDRELRRLAAGTAAFTARFDRIGSFPDVIYLAPEDPAPFVALTRSVAGRWPECPPYGGEFPDVIPHVTLRRGELPAGARLEDLLPVTVRVDELHLAFDHRWRGWRTERRYALRSSG